MEGSIRAALRYGAVVAAASLALAACTEPAPPSLDELSDPAQTRSPVVKDDAPGGSVDEASSSHAPPSADLTDKTTDGRDFRFIHSDPNSVVTAEMLAAPGSFAVRTVDVGAEQEPVAEVVSKYITTVESAETWANPAAAKQTLMAMTSTAHGSIDAENIASSAALGYSLYGGARHELTVTHVGESFAVVRDCVQASNLWLVNEDGTVKPYPSGDAFIDVAGAEPPEVATYRLEKLNDEWKIRHIARPVRTVGGALPENCTQKG